MASSMKLVFGNLSKIHLVGLSLRQSARAMSSKATGTPKPPSKPSPSTKKAKQDPPSEPAVKGAAPYTYEVPQYDDLYFYNIESDMTKYRIPQPAPGKAY